MRKVAEYSEEDLRKAELVKEAVSATRMAEILAELSPKVRGNLLSRLAAGGGDHAKHLSKALETRGKRLQDLPHITELQGKSALPYGKETKEFSDPDELATFLEAAKGRSPLAAWKRHKLRSGAGHYRRTVGDDPAGGLDVTALPFDPRNPPDNMKGVTKELWRKYQAYWKSHPAGAAALTGVGYFGAPVVGKTVGEATKE